MGAAPYNLCILKLVSTDYMLLNNESNKIKEYLVNNINDVTILGPTLCVIPKIYNKYYMQIIIKYKNINQIYNELITICIVFFIKKWYNLYVIR